MNSKFTIQNNQDYNSVVWNNRTPKSNTEDILSLLPLNFVSKQLFFPKKYLYNVANDALSWSIPSNRLFSEIQTQSYKKLQQHFDNSEFIKTPQKVYEVCVSKVMPSIGSEKSNFSLAKKKKWNYGSIFQGKRPIIKYACKLF